MGIIKQIKKMFSKNVDCSEVLENTMFHMYTSRNRSFTIGANIIVPDGFSAVFVCRDKITDILPQGKFAITGANMPKTYNRLHLARANKKGKFKKKFNADLYFVCVDVVKGLKFSSFNPYIKKDLKYGKVKAHSEGLFDIQVIDVENLLKHLLRERAYVTDADFLKIVGGWIGDEVNAKLEQSSICFLDLLTSPDTVFQILNNSEILLDYAGLKVFNINMQCFKVKEKLQKKIEEDIKENKQFVSDINESFDLQVPIPEPIQQEVVKSDMQIEHPKEITEDFGYMTCKNCGHRIKRSAVFCEKCGIKQNNFY